MSCDTTTPKTALVTGGSRGLGRAMCVALAELGYRVAVNYVEQRDAALHTAALIEQTGGSAQVFQADVSRASDAERLVGETHATLGPIDVLVNNAGIAPPSDPFGLDAAGWSHVMKANLDSAFFVTRAVIPGMRERRHGRLVFMSSLAAHTGGVVSAAYAASKAGLEGMMHYYATHLLRHGITSNAIAPAYIESEMVADHSVFGAPANAPLGRKGRPEELASVLKLLVTTEFVTGQTIHINAGRYHT